MKWKFLKGIRVLIVLLKDPLTAIPSAVVPWYEYV